MNELEAVLCTLLPGAPGVPAEPGAGLNLNSGPLLVSVPGGAVEAEENAVVEETGLGALASGGVPLEPAPQISLTA